MTEGRTIEGFHRWLVDHVDEISPYRQRRPLGIEEQVEEEREFQRLLWDAGWLAWGWPGECGGLGGSPLDRGAVYEELWAAGYLVPESMAAVEVVGPAVLQFAPELAKTCLQPYLRGDELWCQGFSEPGAGSDLAALRTRVTGSGDELRVTGQKIWASQGSFSDRCLLLARSGGPDSGHRGLSMLLVDLVGPGIETRAIRAANGRNEFAEIFFEDAPVPRSRVLGELGDGWAIAMSLLQWERGMYAWQRQAYLHSRLEATVSAAGADLDPTLVGNTFVALASLRLKCRGTLRALAVGESPGPDISVDKLLLSAAEQAVLDLAATGLGPAFALADDDLAREIRDEWFYTRATSIYGGAAEVQRNIVAERVLRLPREGTHGRQ